MMRIQDFRTDQMVPWLATAGGLVVVAAYLNFAVGGIHLGERLTLVLAFAIGPAGLMAIVSLSHRLALTHGGIALRAATAYLIVAFALLNLMLVVQQMIRLKFDHLISVGGQSDAAKATLRLVWPGVDAVQLGMDISFDIFYCLGVILLASVLYSHPAFGKIIGISGILVAVALLAFNLWAFPKLPRQVGLVDLGPATGLWWLAVIWQDERFKRKARGGEIALPRSR